MKGVSDSDLRSQTRAGAMSVVWKAPATGNRDDLAGPELLGDGARPGHGLDGPGDDDLAGRVVVGHPHLALGALAGGVDGVVVGAHHRRHGPGVLLGRVVHGLAPLDHEPHALVEAEGAAGGQGGVLAQAVARAHGGLDADALDGVEDDEAEHERGQLGVGAEGELVLVDVERRRATSRPATAEASSTTSHEGCSSQARPMPGRWDP